jgi:hypothetical protein
MTVASGKMSAAKGEELIAIWLAQDVNRQKSMKVGIAGVHGF